MLAAVGFPHLDEHRSSHDEFRDRCDGFKRQLEDDAEELTPVEVEDYLIGWWTRHILEEDMAYKPFVTGRMEAERVACNVGPQIVQLGA